MAKISTYSTDGLPTLADKVIGSDAENQQVTKNYLLSDIVGLVPTPTLQQVLTAGNTATTGISLSNNIVCIGLDVINFEQSSLGFATFGGSVSLNGALIDVNGLPGTAGQFLKSTGSKVEWANAVAPSLSNVLAVGNIGDTIILTGTIYSTNAVPISLNMLNPTGQATFNVPVTFSSTIKDNNDSVGTADQVLTSTGSGVLWKDVSSVYSSSFVNVLYGTGGNSQVPSTTGTPLQVNFGAAQGTVSDPVMMDANGVITFNETGSYIINGFGNIQRVGSSGGVAIILFRALVNGTQSGITRVIEMDTPGQVMPYDLSVHLTIDTPSTTLTWEIMRDPTGVNEGGLYPFNTGVPGWSFVPASMIQIQKLM